MSSSLQNMDWQSEAEALIGDMSGLVRQITISSQHESSDMRIYFDIETLERTKLTVSMDSCGFRVVCDSKGKQESSTLEQEAGRGGDQSESSGALQDDRVYETINALLDVNSPMYRRAFAQALMDKLQSIE